MGGHGALVLALRNPGRFSSVSAFSPICHPLECPWGKKALQAYLGNDERAWEPYDATRLILSGASPLPTRVDQGTEDNFLPDQLHTESLIAAVDKTDYPAEIHYREGYDHSYFFIASFIEDHLRFHHKHLRED